MNSLDALRRMVAHYPGGRPALAARLNKSDEVLRKELGGVQTHKLGLIDAEEIASMCHEAGVKEAFGLATVFSFRAGHAYAIPAAEGEAGCHATASAAVIAEASDYLTAVTQARADGKVSDNDRKAILKEMGELMAAIQTAYQALSKEHAQSNRARVETDEWLDDYLKAGKKGAVNA